MRLKAAAAALSIHSLVIPSLPAEAFSQLPAFTVRNGEVPVPLIAQSEDQWCWAASGEMVMKYAGLDHSQCEQATLQFGKASGLDCCAFPSSSICNSGGHVQIQNYGFFANQLGDNQWLSSAEIMHQIDDLHTPWIMNPHGGKWGHVKVGVGYGAVNNVVYWVQVNDPWPPGAGANYVEAYWYYACGGNGGDCHTEGYDYFNIAPYSFHTNVRAIIVNADMDMSSLASLSLGDRDPEQAVRVALSLFSHSLSGPVSRKLGFETAAEIARAAPDRLVKQYTISLDGLATWKSGMRADSLFVEDKAVFVPIWLGGRIAAVMQAVSDGKSWRFATFGAPSVARMWEQFGAEFYVHVDGLETAYGGRRVAGRMLLRPLFDDPWLGVPAGREMPAEKVFDRLAPPASLHVPNISAERRLK